MCLSSAESATCVAAAIVKNALASCAVSCSEPAVLAWQLDSSGCVKGSFSYVQTTYRPVFVTSMSCFHAQIDDLTFVMSQEEIDQVGPA